MRYTIKKSACFLCAVLYLLSMSGCCLVRRAVKNVVTPTTTLSSEEENKNLRYEVTKDLTSEISIKNWNGSVPDGMEVKYVVVKEVYRDERSRNTEYYDYDNVGRLTYYKQETRAYTDEWKLEYNDDGTLARREYRSIHGRVSDRDPDYVIEYGYNDEKLLVSYSYSDSNGLTLDYKFEYENGHLVHSNYYGENKYTYGSEPECYDYCVVVSNKIVDGHQSDVRICKRTYSDDTFERVLTEQYEWGRSITYYEYNESGLAGWSIVCSEPDHTYKCDAKGNTIEELDQYGTVIVKSEYNEDGDRILYESSREKITTTFTYDTDGNKLTETSEIQYKDNEKDRSYTATTTYDYRIGLRVSEVSEIDGSFMDMTVYAYKAIIVPKE